MKLSLSKLTFYVVIGAASMLLLFNNCGRVGPQGLVVSAPKLIDDDDSKLKVNCEQERKAAFGRTYFQFMRANCTSCHQHTQSHASQDMDVSFNAFRTIGEEMIDYQATHPHGGNQFGAANRAAIDAFLPEWNQAKLDYETCLTETGEEEEEAVPLWRDLKLSAKVVPEIEKTHTNKSLWIDVKWNLSDEIQQESEKGKISGEFVIQAQYWHNTKDEIIGIKVRKPRIKLSVGQEDIYFESLKFEVNDTFKDKATNYLFLNRTVSGGEDLDLASSAAVQPLGWDNTDSTTKIAVILTSLSIGSEIDARGGTGAGGGGDGGGSPTPTPSPTPGPTPTPAALVTYDDLMNGPSALRIFGTYCAGCHGPGHISGIDIRSYASARDNATAILRSMENGSMPRGATLNSSQINKVRDWINGGKKEK